MKKLLNILTWLKKKGISSSVAAVLIATISVTLVGTTYFFSKGLMEGSTAQTFELIDVFQNKVIIRNVGTQEIKEIKTLIDGEQVENTLEPPIQPGGLGTIILEDLTGVPSGKHKLTIISRSMSQTFDWEFEYVTTTTIPITPESLSIETAKTGKMIGILGFGGSYSQNCISTGGNCVCTHGVGSTSCQGTWSYCFDVSNCNVGCPGPLYPHTILVSGSGCSKRPLDEHSCCEYLQYCAA